jgi:hypothetical protein
MDHFLKWKNIDVIKAKIWQNSIENQCLGMNLFDSFLENVKKAIKYSELF